MWDGCQGFFSGCKIMGTARINPCFRFCRSAVGRFALYHEDHYRHRHEHGRGGSVAASHEQYSEDAVADTRKKHDGADGQEDPHG